MMRRGGTAFKALVDRALARLMQPGEALAINTKGFKSPLHHAGLT